MRLKACALAVLVLFTLLVPGVLCHVPLGGGDNHTLATAVTIPDIGKSYNRILQP